MNRLYFAAGLVLAAILLAAGFAADSGRQARAGMPGVAGGAGIPQWGTDIKVDPTFSVTPTADRNYSLAVNPANPNLVIAGYDSVVNYYTLMSGYSSSTDAGRTWSGGTFPGPWGSEQLVPNGDTHVGFDAHGVGYYASLVVTSTLSGYAVLTTTDGATWSTPVPVVVADYSQSRRFADLAIDPRSSGPYAGSLYMGWFYDTTYDPYYYGVQLRYSRDGGRTWSNDVQVSDPDHTYTFGPRLAVAQDGTVYAAFEQLDNFYYGNSPNLYLNRSTDGGQTWRGDRLISGAPAVQIGRFDYKGHELTLIGDMLTDRINIHCSLVHVNHYPTIAVSPFDSQVVYAAWNDGRWESEVDLCGLQGRHSDVAFSRSTDGGETWSSPVRVNDDPINNGVDQFEPTMQVRGDGLIGLTWYDRRYDPNGYLYDLEYAQSTDGGLTWSRNSRVSDASSNTHLVQDYKQVDDIGYRKALAFGPDYVLPSWLDTNLGTQEGDFFTDRGVLVPATATPTGSPVSVTNTPTPDYTPTQTATASATPTASSTRTSTPAPSATLTPTTSSTQTGTATPTPAASITATLTPVVSATATAVPSSSPTATEQATSTTTAVPTLRATETSYASPTPVSTATPTAIPSACVPAFSDVQETDWFYPYVQYLYCHGAISGYSDGTFRPGNNTTRGQMTKIVVIAFGIPVDTSGGPHFTDVPRSNPFYQYIETAYNTQLVSGYSDGTFKWGINVTRGQLSKITVSAARWSLLDPDVPTFSDVAHGSTFYTYIETAYCHGIISGYSDGMFQPGNNATRAQISKIVSLAVQNNGTPCNPASTTAGSAGGK